MSAEKRQDAASGNETLSSLKSRLIECAGGIKKILSGVKDMNDCNDATREQLRIEYLRAAQLAEKISRLSTNSDEIKKFKTDAKDFMDMAKHYGSSVRSKIPDTTFDDVKGLDSVKKIVKSFIFISQNPDIIKYYKIEGGLGMLMYGAPGTGKTMFAEAIAHELQLPLFVITPADIFKSYVGESEQAVKQLFEEMDACPDGAILFVDECESIFNRRTQETKDYKAAVTTELLQRINGFGVNGSKRMIIAATNRPEIIDPAYLRYKRFSHLVHVPPPDMVAKRAIIESKLEGIALADITAEDVLDMTECKQTIVLPNGEEQEVVTDYYSAADICGIIEEACRLALEEIEEQKLSSVIPLTRAMFEKAFAKIRPSISAQLLQQYENFR